MWHIVAIGYLFTALMYAAAQPSIARALIYFAFLVALPCLLTLFTVKTRHRNRQETGQDADKPHR